MYYSDEGVVFMDYTFLPRPVFCSNIYKIDGRSYCITKKCLEYCALYYTWITLDSQFNVHCLIYDEIGCFSCMNLKDSKEIVFLDRAVMIMDSICIRIVWMMIYLLFYR